MQLEDFTVVYAVDPAMQREFALPVTPEPKPIEIMRSDLPINGARISPDGRLIASGGTGASAPPAEPMPGAMPMPNGPTPGVIRLWNVER